MKDFKAALVQMNSGKNPEKNLEFVIGSAEKAAAEGAGLCCFPEDFLYRGPASSIIDAASFIREEALPRLAETARHCGLHILCGTVPEKKKGASLFYKTAFTIGPDGDTVCRYRKRHLFFPSGKLSPADETGLYSKGRNFSCFSIKDFKIGIEICFDLRYPGDFSALRRKGCDAVILPSDFTALTGRDHWHSLLRARAIENQIYILAPNQSGTSPATGISSYGNTSAFGPWGEELGTLARNCRGILQISMNRRRIDEVRRLIPL